MQQSYPDIERDIEVALVGFISSLSENGFPITAGMKTHKLFEGRTSSIVRENDEREDIEIREFSSEVHVPRDKILYGTLNALIECFVPAAGSMAASKERALIEALSSATEKAGNVVDASNKPFSADIFLELLEKIWIDFDRDGKPIMPIMIAGSAVAKQVEKMISDGEGVEGDDAFKKLIDRKRAEWRAREADRVLVG